MFGGVASRCSSRNNHASATLPTPIALRARKRRRDQSPVVASAECQVGFIENGQINGRRRQPGKFKSARLGASHLPGRSGKTTRLTPHPGPLPIGWGEGESPAVSPRSWRRKSSDGQVLPIAEPTAPLDSLSPSEGERAAG